MGSMNPYLMIVWRKLAIKHIATKTGGIRMVMTIVGDLVVVRRERRLLGIVLVALDSLIGLWFGLPGGVLRIRTGIVMSATIRGVRIPRHVNNSTYRWVETVSGG